jgi:hypothetical protein
LYRTALVVVTARIPIIPDTGIGTRTIIAGATNNEPPCPRTQARWLEAFSPFVKLVIFREKGVGTRKSPEA